MSILIGYKFINSYNPSEIIIYFKNVCDKLQNKLIESAFFSRHLSTLIKVNFHYTFRKAMKNQES